MNPTHPIVTSAIAFIRHHFIGRVACVQQRIAESDAAIAALDKQRFVHFMARQRDHAELVALQREIDALPETLFKAAHSI